VSEVMVVEKELKLELVQEQSSLLDTDVYYNIHLSIYYMSIVSLDSSPSCLSLGND
jgi:hypothetical protein